MASSIQFPVGACQSVMAGSNQAEVWHRLAISQHAKSKLPTLVLPALPIPSHVSPHLSHYQTTL